MADSGQNKKKEEVGFLSDQVKKAYRELQEGAQILAEVSARNEALLESIGDGIIATDQDGRITLINSSAMSMLGRERKNIIGQSVVKTVPVEDEKEKEIPLYRRPEVLALSTGKTTSNPRGETYYYVRKDGTRFPVGITVTPFVLGEKIVGTIVVFRDITFETDVDKAKTEFVSLASHQLRTPLSTIRWYAEMLKDESLGDLNKDQSEVASVLAL